MQTNICIQGVMKEMDIHDSPVDGIVLQLTCKRHAQIRQTQVWSGELSSKWL